MGMGIAKLISWEWEWEWLDGNGRHENSTFSHFQSDEEKQSVVLHQLLQELRRTVTHSTVIAHQLRSAVSSYLCGPEDDQQQGRNELALYVNLNGNGRGGNGNNQWEWEGDGKKMNLRSGTGMGMNHWEWEGM